MSQVSLEEHVERVEDAQRELVNDVKRLSTAGREIGRSVGRTQLALVLVGGLVLGGVLVLRARHRRTRVRMVVPEVARPSLLREAARLFLLEVLRRSLQRLGTRVLPETPATALLPERLPPSG